MSATIKNTGHLPLAMKVWCSALGEQHVILKSHEGFELPPYSDVTISIAAEEPPPESE